MRQDTLGDEAHLAAAVARRYYLGGESKTEIAETIGTSRFKVARLIDLARRLGLVKIEVADPESASDPLAEEVRVRFGLRHCEVVRGDARSGGIEPARLVGSAGGRALGKLLKEGDVLGLAWSRATHYAVAELIELPPIPVVQLCGSLVVPGEDTPYDLVRRASALTGTPTYYYHAPLIMGSASGAAAVREQADVARALAMIPSVTVALCSIGSWAANRSSVHDALSPDEQDLARRRGVVGETMGLLFDAEGRPSEIDLAARVVGIRMSELLRVPTVIAMARGAARADATRAAITGGLVHRLIVDENLAHALLRDSSGP